jgi:PAS domain S-box-containing protein
MVTVVKGDRSRILVVDDEDNVLLTVSTILADRGYRVSTASGGQQAIELIRRDPFDLVLTDLSMKDCDGLEVLAAVREHQPETVAIMLTGYASLDSAIEAIRRGAYDYLTKPTNIEEMCQTIERGLEKRRLLLEVRRRVDELSTLNRLVNVGVDTVLRSTRDVDQALERISEIVVELLAPAGGVLFVRGENLEPRARCARTTDARRLLDEAATFAIAKEALRTRTAQQQSGPPHAVLAVPVEFQGRVTGALLVCDTTPRSWNDEQVATAMTIASRAALAIENASLYKEVLREKETLHLILNAAGDGIIGLDAGGRILFFSRAAELLTGLKQEQVRGRPLDEMLGTHPSEDDDRPDARKRAALSPGGLAAGEMVIRGAGGTEIFCDVVCCEVKAERGGQPSVHTVLALRDARERRRQEEQKTNALSHLTHELKTPLTSIMAYVFLLQSEKLGPVSERQRDALSVMRRNGQQLLTMIENMLTSAQFSQGSARFRFQATRVSSIMSEVRDLFEPIAVERGITFALESEGDPEAAVDKDMLIMALNNLVANAIKFTDKGGRVNFAARDRGMAVQLEVHDSGIGIPEEYQERIFERYFQIDHARGGSGLGLGIVRSIIDGHGGQVWVESRSGEGSHFFISIPKTRVAGADASPADGPPARLATAEAGS